MDTQPLYDFAPVARLMLLGVVIALGPLAWVWLRNRHAPPAHRLRVLTLITLFLTCLLVRGVRESVTVNKVLVGVKLADLDGSAVQALTSSWVATA